jgi:F-type H+-transporting ATPase subunit a
VSSLLQIVPGFTPPTGSLSTTTALAVFVAVPVYGIVHEGPLNYLRHYIRPTPLMLPFNVIGELSRTIALAVRLYGNVMSGTVMVGILISLAPFLFPVVIQVPGLITGTIRAYIFAVAMQVADEAPAGLVLLAMLPDTGERYLSTPLFEGIVEDMDDEEIALMKSTPGYQMP